jgi:hypothetical protein
LTIGAIGIYAAIADHAEAAKTDLSAAAISIAAAGNTLILLAY